MALMPVTQRFILHWGEMGTRWGVNRTVAQIFALLYLSPEPRHAEEIANILSVARSNVSTSLRELQGWNLVRVVHVLGDRRDHFEAMKDVWECFQVILEQRKRREIDPTLAVLRSSVDEMEKVNTADTYTKERLQTLLDFFETVTTLYEEVRRMPPGRVRTFAKARGKVRKIFEIASPSRTRLS